MHNQEVIQFFNVSGIAPLIEIIGGIDQECVIAGGDGDERERIMRMNHEGSSRKSESRAR